MKTLQTINSPLSHLTIIFCLSHWQVGGQLEWEDWQTFTNLLNTSPLSSLQLIRFKIFRAWDPHQVEAAILKYMSVPHIPSSIAVEVEFVKSVRT